MEKKLWVYQRKLKISRDKISKSSIYLIELSEKVNNRVEVMYKN